MFDARAETAGPSGRVGTALSRTMPAKPIARISASTRCNGRRQTLRVAYGNGARCHGSIRLRTMLRLNATLKAMHDRHGRTDGFQWPDQPSTDSMPLSARSSCFISVLSRWSPHGHPLQPQAPTRTRRSKPSAPDHIPAALAPT